LRKESEGVRWIRIEYDENGQVVGIEISGITKMLAKPIAKQLSQVVS